MASKRCLILWLVMLLCCGTAAWGQRVIEYSSGMGSRDAADPDVWILYNHVRATHDSMVLYADSARLNIDRNDFTAFGHVKIVLTDTTVIFGQKLFYDGETRQLDIWADTVVLADGIPPNYVQKLKTWHDSVVPDSGSSVLKTQQLHYDRNTSVASYLGWGTTVSDRRTLKSKKGYYNSEKKTIDIFVDVVLYDSSMRLVTDTLYYNTITTIARFVSPTYIYTDTATIYSERGFYHTDSSFAVSTKASRIETDNKVLTCDILHYWETTQHGDAYGHVAISDTINDVVCTGQHGETDQIRHTSFVTDSAMVRMVDEGDTLYMHADTIYVYTDSANQLHGVQAFHKAKLFRSDVQGVCDSVYYHVQDSLIQLFYEPILWYEYYQCSSDSINVYHDSAGVRRADLNGHSLMVQKIDNEKFNQLKGKHTIVYFEASEPLYADILGNAEMVYYVTETDSLNREQLIGVNAGVGADMRIYFHERQPQRVVTYGSPDMNTYPWNQLPPQLQFLTDFKWVPERRPRKPLDIFVW